MIMTVLKCPIAGCGFATADVDVVGAAAILNVHATIHVPTATPCVATPRASKLERPKLHLNSTIEDWNAFIRRWATYRTGSNILDDAASGQLLECTGEQLGNIVLRAVPDFTSLTLDDAIKKLKTLAVIPVALGVMRSGLLAMCQDPDEPFRTFALLIFEVGLV